MDTPWTGIYRHLDDDTLAALASVGLLRRAARDLEAGKVSWAAPPGADGGIVAADGQQVALGAQGPAKARCDCAAPGICKHILAAALWLRAAPEEQGSALPPPSDPLAEAAALAPAQVFKEAGIGAVRKAAALFAECGPVTLTVNGGVALIVLSEPDFSCRFVAGGGFAGMVSEAEGPARAAMHVLALAALWRERGVGIAWPAGVEQAPAPGLATLTGAERAIVARVQAVVLEVCSAGLSHVSELVPAQIRALAMSARVEDLPRLAAMLRTLAGTAALLAARDAASDEREAIKLAARLLALCRSLEHAGAPLLPALRGVARRSFAGREGLALLPLGAHWWETRGGARGLTVSFWDSTSAAVLQAVLARPDAKDALFTRQSAWSAPLWQGAGPAPAILGGALLLDDPRLSDDNRLGAGGASIARAAPRWRSDDPRWQGAGFSQWDQLAAALSASAGLTGRAADCVLLKPARYDKPRLDEARQLLWWPLRDAQGHTLTLRLATSALHHERIGHLDAWINSGTRIVAVLARVERDLHGATLEPVSIVVEEEGTVRGVALDYEAPGKSAGTGFMARLARMLGSRPAPATPRPVPRHLRAVDALLAIAERRATTGRVGLTEDEQAELLAARTALAALGLDVVAAAAHRYAQRPGMEQLLLLVHLCHTCIELDTRFLYE